MSRTVVYSLFCVVTIFSCVDPIRLNTGNGAGTLVVDGVITNESGPYTIKLSRSVNFDNSRPVRVFALPEKGATIVISDDTGFSEKLKETDAGVYKTTAITGVIGRTYSITIKTSDGKTFHSSGETMLPVVNVDTVTSQFAVYDRLTINKNNQPVTSKVEGFYISAVTTDPPGLGNYYRWQADGIFEFFSINDYPNLRICWVPVARLENTVVVGDDASLDGKTFSQRVCVVPYDRPTRYMVKLKQASLTEAAYQYWKASESQQVSTGSIFDPPPATLVGNIKNDNDEPVLGYFGASAIAPYNFLFDRFKASGLTTPDPNPPLQVGDCITMLPGATQNKPSGF